MNSVLRIATRASALAQWQANHVSDLIDIDTELVLTETSGDQNQSVPISVIGGKGVFVKEVQAAVLDGRADIAVHSAKDLPAVTPDGLILASVPMRGNPLDALVGASLASLRPGAVVATGSNRRRVQLAALRPDLQFAELRGNIATRLGKAKGFDAIVMAAAALERLGEVPDIVDVLGPEDMIPQVGQGALAIECRSNDQQALDVLGAIEHGASRRCVDAERAFLAELGGDCSLPAGAFCTIDPATDELSMTALLSNDDSPLRVLTASQRGVDAVQLGTEVARNLRTELDEGSGGSTR